MSLVDLRGRENEPEVRDLLALAHGSSSSLERAIGRYHDREWILVGWAEDGELVACAGMERKDRDIVVHSIAVAAAVRGRGVGRSLLDAVAGVATARRLVAETDDDAVGLTWRPASTA